MNIIDLFLYKIEPSTGSFSAKPISSENLIYAQDLIMQALSLEEGREFDFLSPMVEMATLLRVLFDPNSKNKHLSTTFRMAERLAEKESRAQKHIAHLNKQIHQGMLFIAHFNIDGKHKVIICKADHQKFLSDETDRTAQGLPTEKKIYRSFLCEQVNSNDLVDIRVYDTNSRIVTYWWSDYFELDAKKSDKENTKNVWDGIDKKIFEPIKGVSKADYISLRNTAVRYFRSHDVFTLSAFIDNVFVGYTPFSENISIDYYVDKIQRLRDGGKFDTQFNIDMDQIKAKILPTSIDLTKEIELLFKDGIEAQDFVFPEQKQTGEKGIFIPTPEGFETFSNLKKHEKN